jgi:hypothetical protein
VVRIDEDDSGSWLDASEVGLFDRLDGLRDELSQVVERFDNRLTLERLSFCKHYRQNRFGIAVKFDLAGRLRYAYFTTAENGKHAIGDRASTDSRVRNANTGQNDNGNYVDVFVENVQVVQEGDGVIPSIVRFDLVQDDVQYCRGSDLYFSTFDGRFHFLSRLPNGKADVFTWGFSRESYQFTRGDVQCAPEVVQRVSDDCLDSSRQFSSESEFSGVLSGLRIMLYPKVVEVQLEETVQDSVQLFDVLVGPLNL